MEHFKAVVVGVNAGEPSSITMTLEADVPRKRSDNPSLCHIWSSWRYDIRRSALSIRLHAV